MPLRASLSKRRRPNENEKVPEEPETPATLGCSLIVRGGSTVMGGTTVERSMVCMGALSIYSVTTVPKPKERKSERLRDSLSTHYSAIKARDSSLAVKKEKTVFRVHVQNAITGRSWVLYRTYADFALFRTMLEDHLKLFIAEFPKLYEFLHSQYFPKKRKYRLQKKKRDQHFCESLLEFLVNAHRVVINEDYLDHSEVSDVGLSLMRGFLGSQRVQSNNHLLCYSKPFPVLPTSLEVSQRLPVFQCGTLETVMEENRDDGSDRASEDSMISESSEDKSFVLETSSGEELTDMESDDFGASQSNDLERESDEVDAVIRCRAKKYARNRRILSFLKKEIKMDN